MLYTTKPLYISFIFHKKNIRLSTNIFDLLWQKKPLATRAVSIFRAHMHALVYLAYLKPQYETCFHSFSWNRIVHYIVHTYNLKNIRDNRLIFSLIGLVSCYGISVSQVTINNYVVPFVMIKILSFFFFHDLIKETGLMPLVEQNLVYFCCSCQLSSLK